MHVVVRQKSAPHLLLCCTKTEKCHVARCLQELTQSMGQFGYDILQALVNDIAPDAKVGGTCTALAAGVR